MESRAQGGRETSTKRTNTRQVTTTSYLIITITNTTTTHNKVWDRNKNHNKKGLLNIKWDRLMGLGGRSGGPPSKRLVMII